LIQAFTAGATDAGEAALDMDHGPATSFVKDQYLLTCSDDGTVHLYDFSPFSRMPDAQTQRNSSQ